MRARVLTTASISLALLAAPAARAQYGPATGEVAPNNYPPPLPERQGPAPRLRFELAGEIALAGPVARAEAWFDGEAVLVPLDGRLARVVPGSGAAPELLPPTARQEGPSGGWLAAAGGTRRYRATAEGIIEAEKLSRCRRRWVRSWRIVAPNSTPAPPILIGPRLCYAGLDDRVTCVRASNGHRLWTTDLGDRLSRPLARWSSAGSESTPASSGDREIEGEILLAVPDNGASMIALDAYDGRRLATYDLPPASRLVSAPLALSNAEIAVVREAFDKRHVAVLLLRLLYNDAPPAPTSPSGR